MKRQSWLLALNNIDEKYIEEAKPSSVKKFKRKKTLVLLAASMAVMFALNLVLFIPYRAQIPTVLKYSGSEYYEVIDKLNTYFYEPPKYKNNFEALIGGLSNIFLAASKNAADERIELEDSFEMSGDMLGDAGINSPTENGENYEEVTDNQVKGVIEGDLFKRSDKYIYYYDGGYLSIYSIEGKDSKRVGCFNIYERKNVDMQQNRADDYAEMFLSKDCKTVTIIYCNNKLSGRFYVVSLDVTNPANVEFKNIVKYDGEFVSSRKVDGKLYIVSNYYAKEPDNYKNAKEYVPSYTTENETKINIISADNIYSPDVLSSSGYTVLTKLDEKTLNVDADYALLSFYYPVIYTSKDSFYFTRSYYERKQESEYTVGATMTEICRIDYSGDGFLNMGSVTVEGEVNNQYSMDEYNGILRVFTSTDKSIIWNTELGNYSFVSDETGRNASLFCIDINTLRIVGSVERFAPKGENVKSARFDGNTAYVCTAVQFTDPVYFFDLSNLDNVTYKETGTVEGFSTSLVDFGNGYLLGIGQKDWSTPKIEIYKEEGDKVVSVSAIEMPDSNISTDYKSYYIDRENGYIGMGITSYRYGYYGNIRYVIFKFENEKLDVAYEFIFEGDLSRMRGSYIDEYIYVLSQYELEVIPESELN
ncbi:MAG: beta-propeller domain-containing protein [Clostridia bacterium]|nr:beta-propeller domain-containing protein [Clostridia bacterium]